MNNKWIAISLGSLIGLSHIGMIGMISRQQKFPVVNLPVGPYTSYTVEAGKNGYRINYRANDPKVMHVERDIKKKGGFLGLGNNTVKVKEQYTMEGSQHLDSGGQTISKRREECIKKIGGGESTGRLVGSGVGTAVAPSVASVPIVGWGLAGAVTMFAGDQAADIGGTMSESLSDECEVDTGEKEE